VEAAVIVERSEPARLPLCLAVVSLVAILGLSCLKSRKGGSHDGGVASTGGTGGAAAPQETESVEARTAAERELAEQMDRVRSTGPATPEVEKSFASILTQLRTRLRSSTQAQFLDDRCFRGGCSFTMQFPKRLPYEAIDTALFQDEAFTKWPGGKFRSGVFPSDAKTAQMTWIWFLDDSPTPAAPPPAGP
jgi:hypothetical protein